MENNWIRSQEMRRSAARGTVTTGDDIDRKGIAILDDVIGLIDGDSVKHALAPLFFETCVSAREVMCCWSDLSLHSTALSSLVRSIESVWLLLHIPFQATSVKEVDKNFSSKARPQLVVLADLVSNSEYCLHPLSGLTTQLTSMLLEIVDAWPSERLADTVLASLRNASVFCGDRLQQLVLDSEPLLALPLEISSNGTDWHATEAYVVAYQLDVEATVHDLRYVREIRETASLPLKQSSSSSPSSADAVSSSSSSSRSKRHLVFEVVFEVEPDPEDPLRTPTDAVRSLYFRTTSSHQKQQWICCFRWFLKQNKMYEKLGSYTLEKRVALQKKLSALGLAFRYQFLCMSRQSLLPVGSLLVRHPAKNALMFFDCHTNVSQHLPHAQSVFSVEWKTYYGNPAHNFAIESSYAPGRCTKDNKDWCPHNMLKRLIKTAHEHNIAVVVDVVYNHFGPSDISTWQFDGWSSHDNPGGIYFWTGCRGKTPWGSRPDFGRKEVRDYLRDHVMMLLHTYRFDGLRWDATKYIRYANPDLSDGDCNKYGKQPLPEAANWMRDINNEIRNKMGYKITMAEDLGGADEVTGYLQFNAQWDGDFVHPIRKQITTGDDHHRDMESIKRALYRSYNGDGFQRVIYTESHDEVANGKSRVPEEIWPGNAGSWKSKKLSTLGAVLTFTAPGIPMMFQGQELLLDRYFKDTDPIRWHFKDTHKGIFGMYCDMIKLRRNFHNNSRGLRGRGLNVFHVNNNDKVLAYHRYDQGGDGDDVVVVLNFSGVTRENYRIGFPKFGMWKVRLNTDWTGYDWSFTNKGHDTDATGDGIDGLQKSASVSLGAYSAIVYSQG